MEEDRSRVDTWRQRELERTEKEIARHRTPDYARAHEHIVRQCGYCVRASVCACGTSACSVDVHPFPGHAPFPPPQRINTRKRGLDADMNAIETEVDALYHRHRSHRHYAKYHRGRERARRSAGGGRCGSFSCDC